MCIWDSTPAMLGVPPFRIHTLVEPVRWWKETDKKQESEKDAGTRNAVQSHGAWRARVGVGRAGLLAQLLRAGLPRCRWSADPRWSCRSQAGTSQWEGIQARGDREWAGPRVDLAWRLRMTAMPGRE